MYLKVVVSKIALGYNEFKSYDVTVLDERVYTHKVNKACTTDCTVLDSPVPGCHKPIYDILLWNPTRTLFVTNSV